MKIEKGNTDQLVTLANEIFENVEIEEQDFEEQFDNHNERKFKGELISRKEDLLDIGSSCIRYEPCPICYKCRVKGSHIYHKCDKCPIELCVHQDEHIGYFIKRDNFETSMSKEVADTIKTLEAEVIKATSVPKECFNK